MKKIKIVTTIGPASKSEDIMKDIQEAGANVMRLNFSHGDHEYHQETINTINKIRKDTGKIVSLMLDTKGPEIRTGKFPDGGVVLKRGTKFSVFTEEIMGSEKGCSVTHAGITKDVKKGDTILIDDGLIALRVDDVLETEVKTTVMNTAPVSTYKGVNLPDSKVSLPALSDKDKADLKFGCKNKVDFVAASFIRTKDDVLGIRKFLDDNGGEKIKIISKIESQEGIDNFEEILEATDGVMVARGDLGVEIPIEELPFRQKEMIALCNEAGKFVITATHMLESMVTNPRPTRAEVGDVANAVLDGSDAVMLSGETAKGDYPVKAVQTMAKIAINADAYVQAEPYDHTNSLADAITIGCVETAEIANAKAIVALSKSGKTILKIRMSFPTMPIIAFTPDETTANQLAIVRGAVPVYNDKAKLDTNEKVIELASKIIKEQKIGKAGDKIALLSSATPYVSATTNSFAIVEVK